MKKSKLVKAMVAGILAVVGAATISCSVIARENNAQIDSIVESGLKLIEKNYTITECNTNDYTDITMYGIMKFHTKQYEIEGLGNLSIMTTDMGMMQMMSFMITSFEKKVPLCTFDFMYIGNKRKSYVEFYNLVEDAKTPEYTGILDTLNNLKASFDDVEEIPYKGNWYDNYLTVFMHKAIGSKQDELNSKLFCDSLSAYLKKSEEVEVMSAEAKQKQLQIIEEYSEGLITKGGISTDFFKKNLGEDMTRDFFNKVFFGTDRYREGRQ